MSRAATQSRAREAAPARPSEAPKAAAAEAQHESDNIRRQRVELRPAADAGAGPAGGDLFARPFGALAAGDRFATPGRTVGKADILDFAALTGDGHPQHTDPEWAGGSRFGEQIAHGLLVLSFAVGLLPLDPDRVVALRRVGDAVFKQPVKIGDTVHVEGQIVRTREVDSEHGLVEARLRIVNDRGRLAVRTDVELVWRRTDVEPSWRT